MYIHTLLLYSRDGRRQTAEENQPVHVKLQHDLPRAKSAAESWEKASGSCPSLRMRERERQREREREKERERYIYIYLFIDGERERGRGRGRFDFRVYRV